jgi:hypothetical protein
LRLGWGRGRRGIQASSGLPALERRRVGQREFQPLGKGAQRHQGRRGSQPKAKQGSPELLDRRERRKGLSWLLTLTGREGFTLRTESKANPVPLSYSREDGTLALIPHQLAEPHGGQIAKGSEKVEDSKG